MSRAARATSEATRIGSRRPLALSSLSFPPFFFFFFFPVLIQGGVECRDIALEIAENTKRVLHSWTLLLSLSSFFPSEDLQHRRRGGGGRRQGNFIRIAEEAVGQALDLRRMVVPLSLFPPSFFPFFLFFPPGRACDRFVDHQDLTSFSRSLRPFFFFPFPPPPFPAQGGDQNRRPSERASGLFLFLPPSFLQFSALGGSSR